MPAIFRKQLFQFLVELKFNNERAWFNANKARYERELKAPMQAFIQDMAPRLKAFAPACVADPKRSMFRIYRDTRFSRDKTPYKTHLAARFFHRDAPQNPAPGYYLHLEPGECFCGAGIWMPSPDDLKRLRRAIQSRPREWAPLSKLSFWGESYLRLPKGVSAGERFVEDLKRRHFFTWADFTDRQVLAPDFPARVASQFRSMAPLLRFLFSALGLKG